MRSLHATCVSLQGRGVLILGPPGSGKSDLALRLIDAPGRGIGPETLEARLVADDQVLIRREGDRLMASAPPELKGLIEVRGLGIVRVEPEPEAAVALAVRLVAAPLIERLPERRVFTLLGIEIPEFDIDPHGVSAPARVRAALLYCA